jgi:hypothetical protein
VRDLLKINKNENNDRRRSKTRLLFVKGNKKYKKKISY